MKKKNRIWCLIGLTLIIGIPSIVNGIESINYDREKKAVEQGLRQAEEILGYSVKDEFRYEYGNAEKVLATREAERGYKIIEIIEYDKNIKEHNIEQLSAKLLFDLTRNTGFEVSKGVLGECWIKSCCEWKERQEDDICGLDHNRLSVFDKMKRIYVGSALKLQFPKVGLEVVA